MESKAPQKSKFDQYYIGLDIGTSSVGWAVTDFNYKILRYKGKDMWGVHLFDEAETAKERRQYRCARRRRERQVNRIAWLRELLKPEIDKIDPNFFNRLEESKFHIEDRKEHQKNSLFNDAGYTDAQYHKEFPTVYHLRKALMDDKNRKFDIRLVYLAISHILKSRGNFLYAGKFDKNNAFDSVFKDFTEVLKTTLGISLHCDKTAFEDAMKQKGVSMKTQKLKELAGKGKPFDDIFKMISGGKAKLSNIFIMPGNNAAADNLPYDESFAESVKASEEELKDFTFNKADYDETVAPKLAAILGDDFYPLIETSKRLYDWSVLVNILGEYETLSDAMIARSKCHRSQLAGLKHLVRKYVPGKFDEFFKDQNSADNYQAWIGHSVAKNNKSVCSQEDFYKAVQKLFAGSEDAQNDPQYKKLEDEIKAAAFLNKLRIGSNGVIPHQVHEIELVRILDNAALHYDIFNQTDEDGSVKDKIHGLLTFRIPYYVGPLSDKHLAKLHRNGLHDGASDDPRAVKIDEEHGHAWLVRNPGYEHTPIRPWNFKKVVDFNQCAENFILRMTEFCTYLPSCRVLPKDSLLYTEFMVYNQLNNLKLDGKKLSRDQKEKLVKLCENQPSVTRKQIAEQLKVPGETINQVLEKLTGLDTGAKLSLKSYHDFKKIFGDKISRDDVRNFAEDAIFAITIFGDEQMQLKKRIDTLIDKHHIDTIANRNDVLKNVSLLRYKDWGRFSKEFLTQIDGHSNKTGECYCIIQALKDESDNLMQLLDNKDYTFSKAVEQFNQIHGNRDFKFNYESLVKHLYCSPAVKRSIWRSLVIVKDILRVTKRPPVRIFVEMARDDANKKQENKGKRTTSRKNQLEKLYNEMKKDKSLTADIKALETSLTKYTDDDLRKSKDRLYLYYTQLGKCMYSGVDIDLDKLLHDQSGTIYDIDHIYPQSKVVDNSLDNRVLVLKTLNHQKGDRPLHECNVVTPQAQLLWKQLRKGNLISEEKYERLSRKNALTVAELAGFVNRQLVETRQATKVVCQALKNVFENDKTKIVYSHAGCVSQFRKVFGFGKCRDLNDFHHAKDAYLNIVVGNVYHTRFTVTQGKKVEDLFDEGLNVQLLTQNNTGILQSEIKAWDPNLNCYILAWKPGCKQGTFATVKKMMESSRILFTRYAYENKGGFYDQQILKKGNGQIPIKSHTQQYLNMDKYGGYNKDAGAYFILVDHIEKKKTVRSFEYVPVRLAGAIERDPNRLLQYCTDKAPFGLGLEQPRILLKKVLFKSHFIADGFPFVITGRSNNTFLIRHCVQLVLQPYWESYLKTALRYADDNAKKDADETINVIENDNAQPEADSSSSPQQKKKKIVLTKEENLALYDIFIEKHEKTIYNKRPGGQVETLKKGRSKFEGLKLLDQCKCLKNILALFSCNLMTTDLSLIGGVSKAGTMKKNMNITKEKSFLMVNESPTGLTSQTVDLMAL